jgi:hypothetical protein
MLKGFGFLAVALCASACAMAASPVIGSVTSRGELKIDNYVVNGSGTVFDGSVVETGQSALSFADLRLGNDAVISLSVDSLGILHRDHFELQRGQAELSSTTSFRVEAGGLSVAPPQAHSSGSISIGPGKTVSIAATTGDLEVKDAAGRTIALVHPGHPMEFNSIDAVSIARPSSEAVGSGGAKSNQYQMVPCCPYRGSGPPLCRAGLSYPPNTCAHGF